MSGDRSAMPSRSLINIVFPEKIRTEEPEKIRTEEPEKIRTEEPEKIRTEEEEMFTSPEVSRCSSSPPS